MGLFSTKKKTVVGVQTFDLGTDGYASYYHFRHNALFAAQGNSRAYLKAMHSYKHSVKSSYSSKRLQRYEIPFVSSPFSYTINPKVSEAVKTVTEAKDEAIYSIQDFSTLGTNRDRFNVVINASGVTKDSKISSSSVFTVEDQAIFLAVTVEARASQIADTSVILPVNNITTIYYDGEDSNGRHIFRIGYPSHIFADQRWIGIEFKIKEIVGGLSKTVDYGGFWDGFAYIRINDSFVSFRQERYYYHNSNGPDTYIWLGSDGTELTADDDDPHYFGVFPIADNVYLDRYNDQSIDDARDAVLEHVVLDKYLNDADYTNHYTLITPYYYPSVHYATAVSTYEEEVYSPHYQQDGYVYFDGSIADLLSFNTTVNGEYLAEPLFNVKSRTKTLEEIEQDEAGMTDSEKEQYRRERFFQKKIFDSFSINLDSFASQFADDKIKEMSVGIMFDFSKIEQSQAALSSLYKSMELILPDDFLLVNQKAMDNNCYPCSTSNRISLQIPFGDGNIITRFVLQRQTYDTTETVPSSDLYSLKVKAKATETNDVKNRDFCVELYEAHYGVGSANGKTPLEMRSEVIHDYMQYDNPEDAPQTLQDAFAQFPTKRSCMEKYDVQYYRCQVKSEPTDIAEAMTMLEEHDVDTEGYEGVLFRCRKIPNGDPNSYYKLEKIFAKLVGTRELNTIGEGLNAVYKLKKFDLQNNTTTEYILSDLYSYFSDGQHSYIKKYTEESNSGSDFFLPARANALNSLKFYDYIEAKDILLSGIVFTVQVIKIKWYQQAWFSWLLIIVTVVISVVITVGTGGTGATVGSALLSAVENFAIGIAVSKAVEYLAPKIGLDVADIGLIIAVVSLFYGDGSDTMHLMNLGDKYLKKKLQDEQDKLKAIKKDLMTFKKEAEEALKRLSDTSKSSLAYAYWAIAENINNRTKSGKQYSLEELEYMVEVEKYSVPFQNIYTEDLEAELYKIVNDDL